MKKQFVALIAVLLVACSTNKNPIAGRTDSMPGVSDDGGNSVVSPEPVLEDAAPPDAMTPTTEDAGGKLTDADAMVDDAMVDATVSTDSGTDATVPPVPECPGSGPGTKCEGLQRFACVSGQWEVQEVCDHVCQAGACIGVCDPGDKDCQGQNPRECNANGQWVQGLACSFVCSAGNCTGSCEPADRDCQGLTPRSCNASGAWVQESACSLYCGGEGVCSGVCTPGDRDCSGLIPRSCNSTAQWVTETACPYVCGGEGVCSGVCIPGDRDCQGLVPRSCSVQGQWVAETACSFICGGEGVCSGSCSPNAKQCQGLVPQTCNSGGSWISGSSCSFVCSAGNCGGVCTPGDRDCQGLIPRSCSAQGQWVQETACSFICGGEGVCSGSCAPTTKQCQGLVPQTCNASGQWTSGSSCSFVCSSGTCGGVCVPGTKQCSGSLIQTCNQSGQWDAASACGAVQGATVTCDSGTKACIATCTGSNFDCNSNMADGCEADVASDGNNCGQCGHSCCGGACGSGTCGVYDSGIFASNYAVDAQNIYWSQGGNLNQQPRLGGTPIPLATDQPGFIGGVAVQGSNVFWTTDGDNQIPVAAGVFSKPIGGGTMTTYGNANGRSLLVTANDIFFRRQDNATISYWDRATTVTDILLGGSYTYGAPFITDGQYLYATYTAYGSAPKPIVRVPIHGGTPTVFESYASVNYSTAIALSTDGTNIYYILYIGVEPANAGVWKKPLAGGAAQKLVGSGNGFSSTTATDGTSVYFADANAKQVRKVSVNGGTVTPLYTFTGAGSYSFNSMQVVNECVYWLGSSIHAIAVDP